MLQPLLDNGGPWVHKGVLSENPSFIFQLFWVGINMGLLVPDSLECNAVLMSLRAQKEYTHPDKSEQTQQGWVRRSKINPERSEIKRHIKHKMVAKLPFL